MQKQKGFFGRLADLWRGFWGIKLRDAEAKNAELVFHTAILQRTQQYDKLKDAVTRLIYLRNRIEADMGQRKKDMKLIDEALRRAAMEDDDRAMALIRKKRRFDEEILRLEGEHQRLTTQAESSKESLVEVKKAIKQLKEEREEMLARKTHAMARLDVASALQNVGGSYGATDQALENVREAIVRLEHQAELGSNGDYGELTDGDVSITALRRQAEDESDRRALQELKRSMGERLLSDGNEKDNGHGELVQPLVQTVGVAS